MNETSDSIMKFGWQEGFAVFSVSVSQKDRVAKYIREQAEHHTRATFKDEYIRLLDKHQVEYDPRYLWD